MENNKPPKKSENSNHGILHDVFLWSTFGKILLVFTCITIVLVWWFLALCGWALLFDVSSWPYLTILAFIWIGIFIATIISLINANKKAPESSKTSFWNILLKAFFIVFALCMTVLWGGMVLCGWTFLVMTAWMAFFIAIPSLGIWILMMIFWSKIFFEILKITTPEKKTKYYVLFALLIVTLSTIILLSLL